jgi:hypothetical protein
MFGLILRNNWDYFHKEYFPNTDSYENIPVAYVTMHCMI